MAPAYLTAGLRHIPSPRLLKPGETFILRYKNASRRYKTDVWIAVILPHMFGPGRHVKRRPSGAQPEEGDWSTHVKDRVYSVYLPGRNMYRWAGLMDIYIFNEKTINIMKQHDRQHDGNVWDELARVVHRNPSVEFWKDMSLQELGAKGNRGREVRLVMPLDHAAEDHDDGLEHDSSSMAENQRSSHSTGLTDGEYRPSNVQATSGSFSDSRSTANPSNVPLFSPIGGLEADNTANRQYISGSGLDLSAQYSGPLSNTVGIVPRSNVIADALNAIDPIHSLPKQEPIREVPIKQEPIESQPTSPSSNNQNPPTHPLQSILRMELHQALCNVICEKPQTAEIIDFCRRLINLHRKPESAQIRSFLLTNKFDPDLVPINPTLQVSQPQRVPVHYGNNQVKHCLWGDKLGVGQNCRLAGVSDLSSVQMAMINLCTLYTQAKYFNLINLMDLIALKLQIFWNSYNGVFQCRLYLEVAEVAFAGDYDSESINTPDPVQNWLVLFISEAFDVFDYECRIRFTEFLQKHPNVHAKIMETRTIMCRDQPHLLPKLRPLLASRGALN